MKFKLAILAALSAVASASLRSSSKSTSQDKQNDDAIETNTTRVLVPSSGDQFVKMCSDTFLAKRRVYRDDFSVQIFRWVQEDLISNNQWDTTNLKRAQNSEGHLPDFHRLPRGVISSFVVKTCPFFYEEVSRSVSDPNSMPDLVFCLDPLKHERCPAGVYMPINLIKSQEKKKEVRSVCYNVWSHWDGIVSDCEREFERQNLISQKGVTTSPSVRSSDLRFSKLEFDSDAPSSYNNILPLTADDYPLTQSTYDILKYSNVVSPTLQTDYRIKGKVQDWIFNVMGGIPPHPSNDIRSEYWDYFRQVQDLQLERRTRGDTLVSNIFQVPDLWRDKTLNDAAAAVHNEFPGRWQRECIEDFIAQKVKLDTTVLPERSKVDFITSVVTMGNLNSWSIDTIAATSFAAKYYVGRIRPEEMAWKIATREVVDGVPRDVEQGVDLLRLQRMEDFGAYPEGCPRHPSWPAMHSVGSTLSLWMAVVCDLTPEQLRQAQLTDFAVAYSRTVAGVHYFDDNLAGLKMGQAIIAQELPDYLQRTYGADPRAVRNKIRNVLIDWKTKEREFLQPEWRY